MNTYIDFRSDTVTQPCQAMRNAMANAEVGDDVFADDPTVNQLQQYAAELTGHQAALFAPSGTQSNLIALLAHCQRGDEYIVGQDAHTYKYEGGGAAVLGGIQPQPIEFDEDGSLPIRLIEKKIKPKDHHFARSKLVAIENTVSGKVLSLDYLKQIKDFTRQKQLALHLDGARVFNAAVSQQIPVSEITADMDSVSICLSKGLGAPVGSLLCGSRELIDEAHKWRKMVGGGMRQAGILAAAGLYALNNNIERLHQDHQNAELLSQSMKRLDSFDEVQQSTNMVFARFKGDSRELTEYLKQQGFLLLSMNPMRIVLHKDICQQDVKNLIKAMEHYPLST